MEELNATNNSQEIQNPNPKFDWSKFIMPGSIIIAGLLISLSVLYTSGLPKSANVKEAVIGPKEVAVDDDAFLGNKNASVVLVEFSDFQCPFCRTFWRDTLPLIKSEYIDTGKVKFVYRDFPLSFHPGAMPAAQAAECAEEQGKFWEMHDKIFSEQDKLGSGTVQFDSNDLKKWAGEVGLDMPKFNSCFDSQKHGDEISKDQSDGQAAGVNGTPTIFVNGQPIVGAQPFSAFKALIDAELD
ncbi:MAG: DsbA family protein [Patescibacteria group bacterium]